MELDDALAQIGDIRLQMCRTRRFHGYGAVTTFCTGLAAIAVGIGQLRYMPNPRADPGSFVHLWVSVAVACFAFVAIEWVVRYRASDSSLQKELTVLAIEQFLPCVVVGGLVTLVLCEFAKPSLWMLPGLWQIFFGSGIFASRRLLPGSIILVGVFYVLAGLTNLAMDQGGASFSAWGMAIPFGVGQAAAALILSQKAEHDNAD